MIMRAAPPIMRWPRLAIGPPEWRVTRYDYFASISLLDPWILSKILHHPDIHWVDGAYILRHMAPPGLSPGVHSIGDKQRALQQGLADKEKRHILQKWTQIGGVQRYKEELRQALAGI